MGHWGGNSVPRGVCGADVLRGGKHGHLHHHVQSYEPVRDANVTGCLHRARALRGEGAAHREVGVPGDFTHLSDFTQSDMSDFTQSDLSDFTQSDPLNPKP